MSLVAVVLIGGWFTPAQATSLVINLADGAIVRCVSVDPGDTMTLSFTHSMFGGYVRETWRVTGDQRLARSRFVTENEAAAEYYAMDGRVTRAPDGFVVDGGPLIEDELVIRVNSRGDHYIRVGGETWRMVDLVGQSAQIRIHISHNACHDLPSRPLSTPSTQRRSDDSA